MACWYYCLRLITHPESLVQTETSWYDPFVEVVEIEYLLYLYIVLRVMSARVRKRVVFHV